MDSIELMDYKKTYLAKRQERKYRNLRRRSRTWHYDFMIGRERVRGFAGRTLEEAYQTLARVRKDYEDDAFRGIPNPRKVKSFLLEDMVRDFMTVHAVKKKSYRRDQASEKAILEARAEDGQALFAGREVRKITALDIEKYRALRRRTVKAATVNRELSFLKTVFNKAVEWEKTDRNPAAKVRKEREEGRVRTLEPKEARGLIEGASAHLRSLLVLAIMTGLRRGELFSLKWSDVDLEDRVLTVRAENAKSGKARTVPLNETALRTLERLPRFADFVFPNLKTGRRLVDVKRAFGTACRRAGIKDLRFHDLRHTAATWLIEAGADLVTVAQVLGHSSIEITKKYCHPSEARARAAMERLSAVFRVPGQHLVTPSEQVPISYRPIVH